MHLQPVFSDMPAMVTGNSELLFERGLTLPSGSAMPRKAMDRVIAALTNALKVSS